MIPGITFMLLIVFQVVPGHWAPAPPMRFDTATDCERARQLVGMLTENARTLCVEHRAA
jgi:hypothetical protein